MNALVKAYLKHQTELRPLFGELPTVEGILRHIEARRAFPQLHRDTLAEVLESQYARLGTASDAALRQIARLRDANTFTVTTGQQCGLLLGPMYTTLKILSAIRLCKTLKQQRPDLNFIPVFWLASEDHDIEEINHIHLADKSLSWPTQERGAAGRLSTAGLDAILDALRQSTASDVDSKQWLKWVEEAYAEPTLARATQKLAISLFGELGLLVLDPDDARLKALFAPHIEKDILEQTSYRESRAAIDFLRENYSVQVEGREINFFYLGEQYRERIEQVDGGFQTVDGLHRWSAEEIQKAIRQSPDCFSPNVMMRPVYQECILPNLAYFGGAAEVAYWLEMKGIFDAHRVPYPVLLLRNSALWLDAPNTHRRKNSGIEPADVLKKLDVVKRRWVESHSGDDLSLQAEKMQLQELLKMLDDKAEKLNTPTVQSAKALGVRLNKQLEAFSEKLFREYRRKEADKLRQLELLWTALYPSGSLQERVLMLPDVVQLLGLGWMEDWMEEMPACGAHFLIFENSPEN